MIVCGSDDMAVYKIVTLAALFCLTQCRPDMRPNLDGTWRKIFSAERHTAVKDGTDKLIAFLGANLTVFGDFNRTTDHDILTTFIADKMSLFESQPEESIPEDNEQQSPLPLLFNMTVKELITLGPKPVKNIGVFLEVKAYGQKKKHQEMVWALKSLGSSF